VSYTYEQRVAKKFSPATTLVRKGIALIFSVSDQGNEFVQDYALVQLEPEGQLALSDQDWSKFQMRLKVLDNSSVVPTAPFGLFYHYGVGTNL
jgi:hypothetical protein